MDKLLIEWLAGFLSHQQYQARVVVWKKQISPKMGEIWNDPIGLAHIFQMGWNHHHLFQTNAIFWKKPHFTIGNPKIINLAFLSSLKKIHLFLLGLCKKTSDIERRWCSHFGFPQMKAISPAKLGKPIWSRRFSNSQVSITGFLFLPSFPPSSFLKKDTWKVKSGWKDPGWRM